MALKTQHNYWPMIDYGLQEPTMWMTRLGSGVECSFWSAPWARVRATDLWMVAMRLIQQKTQTLCKFRATRGKIVLCKCWLWRQTPRTHREANALHAPCCYCSGAAKLLTRAPTPLIPINAETPGHAAASASQVPVRRTRSTAWTLLGISHSAVCRLATLNKAVLCQHLVKGGISKLKKKKDRLPHKQRLLSLPHLNENAQTLKCVKSWAAVWRWCARGWRRKSESSERVPAPFPFPLQTHWLHATSPARNANVPNSSFQASVDTYS